MKFLRSTFYGMALAIPFAFSAVVQADSPVDVSYQANSISVMPADLADFEEMYLRVTGPANSGTTESHSQGEPIVWTASTDSEPGKYVYKVLVISTEDSVAQRRWHSGSFEVNEHGELIQSIAKVQSDGEG